MFSRAGSDCRQSQTGERENRRAPTNREASGKGSRAMQRGPQEVLQCPMSHSPGIGIGTRARIKVKVEVLYFKGCPNHKPAVEQVRKALRSEGLPILVKEVKITDPPMPQKFAFLGSPSIRI